MTEKAIGLAELSLFAFCKHNNGGLMRGGWCSEGRSGGWMDEGSDIL